MPEVNVDALLLEDGNAPSGTPFRYGKIFDVEYNLNNSGTWEILDDGSHNSDDIVRSFCNYFNHLKDDGLFIIEVCSLIKSNIIITDG